MLLTSGNVELRACVRACVRVKVSHAGFRLYLKLVFVLCCKLHSCVPAKFSSRFSSRCLCVVAMDFRHSLQSLRIAAQMCIASCQQDSKQVRTSNMNMAVWLQCMLILPDAGMLCSARQASRTMLCYRECTNATTFRETRTPR